MSDHAPAGFVTLADFDPGIRQVRADPTAPTPEGLLTLPAADALSRAHRLLARNGWGLVVSAAYRPWRGDPARPVREPSPTGSGTAWSGAAWSGCVDFRGDHSRGSTVDVFPDGADEPLAWEALAHAMRWAGFGAAPSGTGHFTLAEEPYPNLRFDFPTLARAADPTAPAASVWSRAA
ncbi:hypothetical protein ACN20G_27925 (plasmid) [Streptomyces sp. BI20]|uniref:hypothetical protein n=1 Tax=Streptomyces sp. BI20 TaxID=3403460 RepID=UPI003C7509E2